MMDRDARLQRHSTRKIAILPCGGFFAAAVLLASAPRVGGAPEILFPRNFDPFACLGLPRSGIPPAKRKLKDAFRRAAVRWHPDHCREASKSDCEGKMQQVNLAREVLSDARKLQMWGAWRRSRDEDMRQRARSRPPPPRPPRPAPPPPPPPRTTPNAGEWREVSREKVLGINGAQVESITRERDLLGTPMVQIEVVERTCYAAQRQCQKKIVERRRRRREEDDKAGSSHGSCSTGDAACQKGSDTSYEVRLDHCHLSTSEEVIPTGPPPHGASFYRDIQTVDGCKEKCNINSQCVAFQVQERVACWLYRFKPREGTLFRSPGWACGMRRMR